MGEQKQSLQVQPKFSRCFNSVRAHVGQEEDAAETNKWTVDPRTRKYGATSNSKDNINVALVATGIHLSLKQNPANSATRNAKAAIATNKIQRSSHSID